ncbi:diguanylate cyclase [Anaerovorax odorimutans]|uniref:Diguanylate cyclase n=1 Tax=Anaerovorax odorimutans TaxID=109327 RepID=A0ABT1RLN6_9FIRM|nr:GGDEF domain-containing protein [Anaerovorax odorimutans]MCQ4636109.1 diguanylate cyclase [Anaerovorax odorimutans]
MMHKQHRFFCVFALILILCACPLVSSAAETENGKDISYYTDIPEVTKEEIADIESIKKQNPDGLVYGMIHSEEAFVAGDGEIEGYTRLICQRLSDLFGLKITPRIMEWNELMDGLGNGSVDLCGDLTATPDRREKYFMTSSIAERSFSVFRNGKRAPLDLINGSQKLRYGFLKGSITYERVRETSAVPFEAVFVQDYQQGVEKLRDGTIDGFIYEAMSESLLEYYPDIAYQEYYPVAFTSASLATADPELSPLIDVVQKYLEHGGKEELSILHEQGEKEYLRHNLYKKLTEEEKEYLEYHIDNKIPVPVAAEFDNYPVSFYNKQEKEWQGIAHDILKEMQSLTGLTFEVTTGADEPWNSILDKLDRGDAAIITNLLKSKDREGHYLWPEEPYSVDTYVLLSRMDRDDMTISQVSAAKVGLLEGSAYEEIFNRIFPDHTNSVLYPDAQQCFEALDSGEVDLVMMPRHLLLYITNYMERPGFKVNVALDIPCESYFGFNKEEKTLCSIVSKAQEVVDCEEITDHWERRVFDYDKKLAQQRIPYLIGICALLIIVLVLVVILYRKRERSSRQMVITDHLTSLYNRYFFEEQLQHEWNEAIKYRLPLSLLTIDIDCFKEYNDTYGHPQGDLLLQTVSAIFREALMRPGDFAARTGGDEFSILLPNTDLEGAAFVAEKIRRKVESAAVENLGDGKPTSVTVSIGVACVEPCPDDCLADFVAASDKVLYKAKNEGRNRVYTS